MSKQNVVAIGAEVADFILKDQNGQAFQLSAYLGKKVLLSLHPLAWTPVCASQMKSLESRKEIFDSFNAVAVGISVDSVPCKAAWAKDLGVLKTSLLSDFWPHGHVAQSLGLFREPDGFSERANVIIGAAGIAVFVKVYPLREIPDINEIVTFLEGM
ncbi:MAG: redoxin domain-containing protein [Deltaproteobacteria bacterium]|nr:redoxin domain-containing protein [Deltaproteobacteria bacterium]